MFARGDRAYDQRPGMRVIGCIAIREAGLGRQAKRLLDLMLTVLVQRRLRSLEQRQWKIALG
jgi:hypothetical protein